MLKGSMAIVYARALWEKIPQSQSFTWSRSRQLDWFEGLNSVGQIKIFLRYAYVLSPYTPLTPTWATTA